MIVCKGSWKETAKNIKYNNNILTCELKNNSLNWKKQKLIFEKDIHYDNINGFFYKKVIYMTYKKNVPDIVFLRWKVLNPTYTIQLSLDNNCILFLEKYFNSYVSNLFKKIKVGMYKADLWRLCMLYVNSGVYSDVDIVPYLNIDTLDKNISFYSCLSRCKKSIFQAFMSVFTEPKNPLILCFLLSYLQNNPHTYNNGPTFDMYKCLSYNINTPTLQHDKPYIIENVKIRINIGSSKTNIKYINLFYFPDDLKDYTIILGKSNYKDTFSFNIKNNILEVKRTDKESGWGHTHICYITIPYGKRILLFNERGDPAFVTHYNRRILLSRDPIYKRQKGW